MAGAGPGDEFEAGPGDRIGDLLRLTRWGEQILFSHHDEGGGGDGGDPIARIECEVRVPLLDGHLHLLLGLRLEREGRRHELRQIRSVEHLRRIGESGGGHGRLEVTMHVGKSQCAEQGALIAIAGRPGRVHDRRRDLFRVRQRQFLRDRRAQGPSEHVRAGDLQCLEQSGSVLGQRVD